jgi:hypothetical protein
MPAVAPAMDEAAVSPLRIRVAVQVREDGETDWI